MNRAAVFAVVCALCLSLSACGFHLRGSAPTDSSELFNVDINYELRRVSPFVAQYFIQQLEFSQAENGSAVDVYLSSAAINKRVIVLDEAGRPAERQMIFTLTYRATRRDGEQITSTLTTEKNYFASSEALSAIDPEEKRLQRQLMDDAIVLLRTRLSRWLKDNPA